MEIHAFPPLYPMYSRYNLSSFPVGSLIFTKQLSVTLRSTYPTKQEMTRKEAVYYANEIASDSHKISKDLIQTAQNYIKRHKITPKDSSFWESFDKGNGIVATYYNNFEICDFDFFLQREIVEMTDWIVDTLGIYRNRWGDAPLRYMTLSLFAGTDQILTRTFEYRHPCK